jgi:hypothetical protein
MSNSQTSKPNPRFAVLALVVIVAAATALAFLASPFESAGRGVAYGLAQTAFDHHDYAVTVTDLKYYHPDSLASLQLETKAYLEEGSDQAAVTTAQQAHVKASNDQTATLLLGAAYALHGQKTDLAALTATQKAPETIQGLKSLQTANIARAQELYVLGLLKSSQAILVKLPAPSVQRSLLQAHVALGLQPGRLGALAATPFAKEAVALDPSSLPAQKLFISVSRETGATATADNHQALMDKLELGKP